MSALDRVSAAVPEAHWNVLETADDTPCIEVQSERVHTVARLLRDVCGFETNVFVTAIDRTPAEPRFEVRYQFLSITHNDRLSMVARVEESSPTVPSIVDLWPGVGFAERECFDMFGLEFAGHTGLKRLLMPEEYTWHPLRKDFPHQGIEPDRLYREWKRQRDEDLAR